MHYWADLQSVQGFRCYDNKAPSAKCQRVLVLSLWLVCSCNHNARPQLCSQFSWFNWHDSSQSNCQHLNCSEFEFSLYRPAGATRCSGKVTFGANDRPQSTAGQLFHALVMAAHSNGQAIIFYHRGFYLSSFFLRLSSFLRLISAVRDWMSTILPHDVTLARI